MSKKLETARGRLFGLDIDLVNLRKEVYDGVSRNPDMEFGTAEEDAFRRDATVNALFFHLGRQEVIDLTGKGLEDLDARIMRTPLDPRQTFMDDPLRVLRLIRVGSKLGFTIDPEAMRWMRDKDIQRALDTMITRDRVNIELFKMTRDVEPAVAFQHMFDANLYTPIFLRLNSPLLRSLQARSPVLGPPASPSWLVTWPRAYRTLDFLLRDKCNLGLMIQSEDTPHLWIMAAFAPIAELRHANPRQAVQEVIAAIRAPVKVSKLLESSLRNFDSIRTAVDAIAAQPEQPPSRSLIAMAIRSWGVTWTAQLTYVILAEAVYTPHTSSSIGSSAHGSSSDSSSPGGPLTGRLLEKYSAFADFVREKICEMHTFSIHCSTAMRSKPSLVSVRVASSSRLRLKSCWHGSSIMSAAEPKRPRHGCSIRKSALESLQLMNCETRDVLISREARLSRLCYLGLSLSLYRGTVWFSLDVRSPYTRGETGPFSLQKEAFSHAARVTITILRRIHSIDDSSKGARNPGGNSRPFPSR